MLSDKYTSVPLDEENDDGNRGSYERKSKGQFVKNVILVAFVSVVWFLVGYTIGGGRAHSVLADSISSSGLLPPQAFIPSSM